MGRTAEKENYACVMNAWVFYMLISPWGIKTRMKRIYFCFHEFRINPMLQGFY